MSGDTAVSPSSERTAVDATWIRRALEGHWPSLAPCSSIAPLDVNGTPPLTHTGSLWEIGDPRARAGYVLKIGLDPAASRPHRFYELKAHVLKGCARHGVPVTTTIPTATGGPVASHDGRVCELSFRAPGTTIANADARTVEAIVTAGLGLRHALDRVPPQLRDELASMPPAKLVEEERWGVAMTDALTRLRPIAANRRDAWGRAVTRVLTAIAAAAPLLNRLPSTCPTTAPPSAVIHADLHHHHFLLSRHTGPRIVAILDFDNLQVGDPRLDLAWIAYTVASVADEQQMRRSVEAFARAACAEGLLSASDRSMLMPALMIHALPVLVDIAKDILERDLLDPTWLAYFRLLDIERMLLLHRLLTEYGA